jgi:hypothetical protein
MKKYEMVRHVSLFLRYVLPRCKVFSWPIRVCSKRCKEIRKMPFRSLQLHNGRSAVVKMSFT